MRAIESPVIFVGEEITMLKLFSFLGVLLLLEAKTSNLDFYTYNNIPTFTLIGLEGWYKGWYMSIWLVIFVYICLMNWDPMG